MRLILVGLAIVAIAAVLLVLSDPKLGNRARLAVGLEPLTDYGVAPDADAIPAEIARLAAIAVPNAPEREAPPATLGDLAGATRSCMGENGGMLKAPKERAEEGLQRYLVVLAAAAAGAESPLVAERFHPLSALGRAGPRAVAKDGPDAASRALLAEFHALHRDVGHPLYDGLELYDQTFDALDFQALADRAAEGAETLGACAVEALWPAPAEAAGTMRWHCEGTEGEVVATLLPGDPPGLKLDLEGRSETGQQVSAASGARFEGSFGAFWMKGAEATLEPATGGSAPCTLLPGN